MGGKGGAKQKIPRYNMSAHYGICQGPVDEVKAIYVGEKIAWQGSVTGEATVNVDNEGLFGGIQKEGGVSGAVDVMFGGPDQVAPASLAQRIGLARGNMPGYRGLLSMFFRGKSSGGFYWTAQNPYLKPLWVRATRYPKVLGTFTAPVPRNAPGRVLITIRLGLFRDTPDEIASANTIQSGLLNLIDTLESYVEQGVSMRVDVLGIYSLGAPASGWTYDDDYPHLRTFDTLRAALASPQTANAVVPQYGLDGISWPYPRVAGTGDYGPKVAARKEIVITNRAPTEAQMDAMLSRVEFYGTPVSDLVQLGHLLYRSPYFDQGHFDNPSLLANPYRYYWLQVGATDVTQASRVDNTPEDGIPVFGKDDVAGLTDMLNYAASLSTLQTGAVRNEYDANPSQIIYECLTNTDWGLGVDEAGLDTQSFVDVAWVLFYENLGLSMMWNQASSVQEFINDILDCIKGSLFTHPRTGKLTIKLMREDYWADGLREINPDNAELTNFSRKAWGETINEMKVTWTNPVSEKEESVYSQDLGNIAMQGTVVSDSRNYYGVRSADLAQKLADRELRSASAPLCSCEATVDRSLWDITPLECVKLTWPEYGVESLIMRVMKVSYGQTGDSAIKVTLVEDIFGLPQAEFTSPPASEWINPEMPPVRAGLARILSLPAYALGQAGLNPGSMEYPSTRAALLVASPTASGSAEYRVALRESTPSGGTRWVELAGNRQFAGRGNLAIPLEPGARTTIPALARPMGPRAAVDDFLLIGPDSGSINDLELALVTGSDPVTGDLTILQGVLDTTPRSWPAGTPVWVLSLDSLDVLPMELTDGQTAYAKVMTVTAAGQTPEAESPIFAAPVAARAVLPTRPANVKIDGVGFGKVATREPSLPVTWATRNRLFEDSAVYAWDDTSIMPEQGQTTRIRVRDKNGVLIDTISGLGGTSYNLDLTSYALPVDVTVLSSREFLESWQGHTIRVEKAIPQVPGWLAVGHNSEPYASVFSGMGWVPAPALGTPLLDRPDGVAFNPQGTLLAVAHYYWPYLTVYSTSDWSQLPALPGVPAIGAGKDVAWSPDGSELILVAGGSNQLTVFNTADWSYSFVTVGGQSGTVTDVAFSPDGAYVAVTTLEEPGILVYHAATWQPVSGSGITLPGFGHALSWSPTGRLAVAHEGGSAVSVFEINGGGDLVAVTGPASPGGTALDVAWSPDGSMLAVAHIGTHGLTVYNTSTWTKLPATSEAPSHSTEASVSWSPDGQVLTVSTVASPYLMNFDVTDWSLMTDLEPPIPGAVKGLSYASFA